MCDTAQIGLVGEGIRGKVLGRVLGEGAGKALWEGRTPVEGIGERVLGRALGEDDDEGVGGEH